MPQNRSVDRKIDDVYVSIIMPVLNEEDNIPELFKQLKIVLLELNKTYEVIFVNDGSYDNSFYVLKEIVKNNKGTVKVISLSRNFGHQLALSAGLNYCKGRFAVVMDADLQDPPEEIKNFVKEAEEGSNIVYGKRVERQGETFLKKFSAKVFCKLLKRMTAIDIPEDVGDFYLIDRNVIDIVNSMKERHRFIRGLISWVGFKSTVVEYARKPRFSGRTKFGLWKMIKFSIDAITSFSFFPLRFVSWLGAMFSITSFCAILYIFYLKIFTMRTVQGWSSIMAVVLLIGGIQLLAIGIIGEYIARIGDDVKRRPLYNIDEILE